MVKKGESATNAGDSEDDEFHYWAREVDDEIPDDMSGTLLECADQVSEECEGKAAMESDDETGAAASNGIVKFLDSAWYQAIIAGSVLV